jgi:hypothetical protein
MEHETVLLPTAAAALAAGTQHAASPSSTARHAVLVTCPIVILVLSLAFSSLWFARLGGLETKKQKTVVHPLRSLFVE